MTVSTSAESQQPRECPTCGATVADAAFYFCVSCGARLDVEPGELVPVDDEDDESNRGVWWRSRRFLVLAGVAVLLLPLLGFFGWQWSGMRQATGPVEEFFAALEEGDGPAAAALLANASLGDGNEEGLDSPIWEPGALESGYSAPTDVELDTDFGAMIGLEQRPDRSTAAIDATFVVAGSEFELEFWVERIGSGWSRDWQISAVSLETVQPVGSSTPSRAASATPAISLVVPPGEYDVAVEDSELFADSTGRAVVGGSPTEHSSADGAVTVDLDVEAREGVHDVVESQMRDLIDDCAQPHQLDWQECPFDHSSDSPVSYHIEEALQARSEWEVESYPEVEVYVDGQTVCTRVTAPGQATGELISPENEDAMVPHLPGSNDEFEAELTMSPQLVTVRDDELALVDGCTD